MIKSFLTRAWGFTKTKWALVLASIGIAYVGFLKLKIKNLDKENADIQEENTDLKTNELVQDYNVTSQEEANELFKEDVNETLYELQEEADSNIPVSGRVSKTSNINKDGNDDKNHDDDDFVSVTV